MEKCKGYHADIAHLIAQRSLMSDMNVRRGGPDACGPVVASVLAIPVEWESITRSELLLSGTLEERQVRFLLGLDVTYCISNEQAEHYRALLHSLQGQS